MKIRSIVLVVLFLIVGCKKADQPKHFDLLKLNYKPYQKATVERRIPIVFTLVDANSTARTEVDSSQVSYGTHWVCLGNYDLLEKPEKPNTEILKDVPPGLDIAPIRACITINDKEGANAAAPLQPGTYYIGLTPQMPNRIASGVIVWDKGKLGSQATFNFSQMKGQLRLDSVSEESFSGEVDVSDGDNSIAGTFNVKAKIKTYTVKPLN